MGVPFVQTVNELQCFVVFLSIRPIIDSFLVFFGAVICWRSVLTFRLRKRERYSLVLDILFFCCFIQLTCHVTKTSSISGLHAQKIGKPQIEFLTSSQVSKMHILFFERSKHSLDKMASPSYHQTNCVFMHAADLYNVFWRNIVSRQIKFCLGSLILIA